MAADLPTRLRCAPQCRRGLAPTVLLIAPTQATGASATNIVGGNKVMADEQIRELKLRGFTLDTVDASGNVTNLPRWKIRISRLVRLLRVALGTAQKIGRADVVFLIVASFSAIGLGSFFWVVCKIARKPLVMRITGGDLVETYLKYGALARGLANRTYMRCSLVYVETQQLYREFSAFANFRWFPNTRNIQCLKPRPRVGIHKLIFLARLDMDKGLGEVLDACQHLPKNCHLNVFGPSMSNTDFSRFEDHLHASYRGVLEPKDVPRVLAEHDLLLLPSYCGREGYPGSILEAFQCGVPVIATRWGGIPELVEHEKNGLLVEPRSAGEIKSAIDRLLENPDLYGQLRRGAKRQGEHFRSTSWYDLMDSDLRSLVPNPSSARSGQANI